MNKMITTLLSVCLPVAFLAGGCAGVDTLLAPARPNSLTEQEIIAMAKAKIPQDEILRKIKEGQGVYALKTQDVLRLAKEGVPLPVIDYMMDTGIKAELSEQRQEMLFRSNSPYWDRSLDRKRYCP